MRVPRDVERWFDVAVPFWRGLDAIRMRAVERSRGLLRAGAIQWRESYLEATLGGTVAMFLCQQSSMSYGREWESVMGYCLCPAEKDEFNTEWAALRSGREVTMACGECTRNRCPAEEESAVMWAATDSMETASCVSGLGAGFACVRRGDGRVFVSRDDDRRGGVPCVCCRHGVPSGVSCGLHGLVRAPVQRQRRVGGDREQLRAHHVSGGVVRGRDVACDGGWRDGGALVRGGLTRVCRENGEWSSVVSGEGCYCEPTVVEERGTYIFARTEPLATVVKACATMYADTIRYTCSLGGWWTDLVKECERIACPGETMEGECSCPAEVVYHSDGNMYLMEEVVAGEVVSANMTGYVWRSWSTTRQAIG